MTTSLMCTLMMFSLCLSGEERDNAGLWLGHVFYWLRAPPLMTLYSSTDLLKDPASNAFTLWVRVSTQELWRVPSQSITKA